VSRILLPPWRTQPQWPARIDRGASINQGLVFVAPMGPGDGLRDFYSGARGAPTGMGSRGFNRAGSYPLFSSGNYVDFTNPPGVSGTTPITIAWTQDPRAHASYSCLLAWKPTGATNQFLIYQSSTDSNYAMAIGPRSFAAQFSPSTGLVTDFRLDHFAVTLLAGTESSTATDYVLWRNGVRFTTASTIAFSGGTSNVFRVGAMSDGSDPFEGLIGNFHIWNRVLTDSEAQEWTRNPFITRAPRRRTLWEAAAGGTNGTASGATVLAPRTLVAGTATGVRNATASGATVLAPRTLIAGTASAGTNGTAAGAIVSAARSLIAGTATGAASAAGAIVSAARSLIAGTAAAAGFAPGATMLAPRTLIAGTATGVRNATASGALLLAPRSLLGGGAYSDAAGGTPLWRFIGLHVGRVGL
jgi:hypothetical protein